MIDLHLHMDGSLTPELVGELAAERSIRLPVPEGRTLAQSLRVPDSCRSLNDYLACFHLPLLVLQDPPAVEKAFDSLCRRLKRQGLAYAEIRFAPQLHLKNGCTQEEITEAAIRGIARSGFFAGLILCCMRGKGNEAENLETLETASRRLGRGVAAADLAGAEALYSTRSFSGLFARAAVLGLPLTTHAGEAGGPDSVASAVSFGAVRIGHGLRSVEDPQVMSLLAEQQICLELCPTSNLQTGACPSLAEYPVRHFLELGIPCTINTDNMTVSGTDIFREHSLLQHAFSFTAEEMGGFLQTAIRHAFLDPEQKQFLRRSIGI